MGSGSTFFFAIFCYIKKILSKNAACEVVGNLIGKFFLLNFCAFRNLIKKLIENIFFFKLLKCYLEPIETQFLFTNLICIVAVFFYNFSNKFHWYAFNLQQCYCLVFNHKLKLNGFATFFSNHLRVCTNVQIFTTSVWTAMDVSTRVEWQNCKTLPVVVMVSTSSMAGASLTVTAK